MNCSIVVATYNRAAILQQTLTRLCDLPSSPPIVVVDNGSTDDTLNVAGGFGEQVSVVRAGRNVGAAARTLGVRSAQTPLVAFCDDDCWWAHGALILAEGQFKRDRHLGVVNARVMIRDESRVNESRVDEACVAMRAGTEATHGHGVAISFFMAGACIIRREAYLDAGGYHPRYHIGAEESLLSLDLAARGWSMRYCDDIVLYHDPSPINRVPDERRRLTLRNRLWTVWLRHSVAFAIRATRWYLHEARSDPIVRQAFLDAVRGLPWVLRERRPISRTLEKEVEALGMLLLE